MTVTAERDTQLLRAGLEKWLGRAVGEITRPAPGWSCETVVLEGELVVRLPPLGHGIFPAYDLATQAAVQDAVASAGVPTASPTRYEPDRSFLGAPFVVMPFVDGPIPGEFTPTDPWLRSLRDDVARRAVWRGFLDTLLSIGSTPQDGLHLRAGLDAELEFWDRYVAWATKDSPPPRLTDALAWCRSNRPVREPAGRLLWGDVRLGNVVFDRATLAPKAVLDWDMASVGPIEMDLAWFLALEQVQADLAGVTVPGFGTREEAVAIVERGIGRKLLNLAWYEAFALVRASAVSTRIAVLFEESGREVIFKVGDDPVLAAAEARISSF